MAEHKGFPNAVSSGQGATVMAGDNKTGNGALRGFGHDGSRAHVNSPADRASEVINNLECCHAVSFSKVSGLAVTI